MPGRRTLPNKVIVEKLQVMTSYMVTIMGQINRMLQDIIDTFDEVACEDYGCDDHPLGQSGLDPV